MTIGRILTRVDLNRLGKLRIRREVVLERRLISHANLVANRMVRRYSTLIMILRSRITRLIPQLIQSLITCARIVWFYQQRIPIQRTKLITKK
jgi:hypothetical protein